MASNALARVLAIGKRYSKNGNNCETGINDSDDMDTTNADAGAGTTVTESIPVYQIRRTGQHGTQYAIWDAEQALHLRKSCGILGDFVGTLPKHLSQNQFLTLPLFLSNEEVTYGTDKGTIHVVSDNPNDYPKPSTQAAETFRKERDDDINRQIEEVVVKQREERQRRAATATRKRKFSEIAPPDNQRQVNGNRNAPVNGKTSLGNGMQHNETEDEGNARKMQRTGFLSSVSRSVQAVVHSIVAFNSLLHQQDDDDEITEAESRQNLENNQDEDEDEYEYEYGDEYEGEDKDMDEHQKEARQRVLDEKARHQAHLSSLVITATSARDDEVGERKRIDIVPCPPGMTSERRKRRRQVFENLLEKGYVISCGAKFGADFLAYAGDPQLFHAALAVVVVDGKEAIGARDIVALGRLGDSTRKRTVLAWVNEKVDGVKKKGTVEYVGVQWEETLP